MEQASELLVHVNVLGLLVEQLGNRLGRGPEAATEVEPHGVRRRRGGDDHGSVTRRTGDLLEPFGQLGAEAHATRRGADVEERQLRDPRPDVGHDDTDADQPPVGDGTESDPTSGEVPLHLAHLRRDGVIAIAVGIPGWGIDLDGPGHQIGAALVVEHVDPLRAVDLADPPQVRWVQPSHLDHWFHRVTLTHRERRRPLHSFV